VNALDFNQIEHLVELHQITDVYLMVAYYLNSREKPAFAGLEYEFVVPRFEFGESRKIKKYSGLPVLPFFPLPKRKNTTYTHYGSLQRFTESVNKRVKDGASTTIISLR
jgi:hypothetical protein